MSHSPSGREKLDFEDDEERAARLGNLFSSISTPPTSAPAPPPGFPLPTRPHAMPESDVLARARAFLPLLAASNADLLARAQADPSSVVIENPAQGDVVAMDVGLGVFDVNGAPGAGMGPVVERDAEVWERANEGMDEDEDEEEDEEDDDGESSSSESGSGSESDDEAGDKEKGGEKGKKEQAKPKVVEI